jgi:cytochrome c-type biogenesis protein CcsB
MVKRFVYFLFSMQLMAALLILYAVSIAFATFIENDFGTTAAKASVYNTFWFELIMFLLIVNFLGNITRYKLLTKRKFTVFLFHAAFIIILFGAFITRYFGNEGYMHIREGAISNEILSAETYLKINIRSKNNGYTYQKKVLFSPLSAKSFKEKFTIDGKEIFISSVGFIPNAAYELKVADKGQEFIELIIPGSGGRESIYIAKGKTGMIFDYAVSFDTTKTNSDFSIVQQGDSLTVYSKRSFFKTNKDSWKDTELTAETFHSFKNKTLYKIDEKIFVLKNYYKSAELVLSARDDSEQEGPDAVKLLITTEGKNYDATLFGNTASTGRKEKLTMENLSVELAYGAIIEQVPFSLKLNDFILDRYPGSNSPSSFKSKIVLIDQKHGINQEREIYMNNVLKHRGYRFYQSSYDADEQGTILSVNKDLPGTLVSYLGYLLLSIGMLLSLFNRNSRFHMLSKTIGKTSLMFIFLLTSVSAVKAQDSWQSQLDMNTVEVQHARKFSELLVQDNQGRIKPVNTLASEILRKVSRKRNFEGLTSEQVVLGMVSNPGYWQTVPLIKVSHDGIKDLLGMKSNHISFIDITFRNPGRTYILAPYVEEAYRKKPAYRSKFDNEIIRVDERVNICYVVFMNSVMKVLPVPDDPTDKWYAPGDSITISQGNDTINISHILSLYYQTVNASLQTGDWSLANEYLGYVKTYQKRYGSSIMPPAGRQNLELWYNKASIFDRVSNMYGLFGFIVLILNFIALLSVKFKVRLINRITFFIFLLLFVLHAAGLAIRWYISGHAPWSNGYEALVYISWAGVLVGILFYRKSPITLPAMVVLAFLILHVAHLSWMDPEITTLVPVLKSVWLVIHVAIITASYAFLGLGALLALVNLVLMIFKTKDNYKYIDANIQKLSGIIEMALVAGLYMLTIGTFLGGVWANESWGRYWGWDPKEAWALITIILYAFVAHLRLIPGLKGFYTFNLFGLFSFASVIMTYFGVNYYLAGLHSYAKGDPLPVPGFVIYTVVSLIVIAGIAFVNHNRISKKAYGMRI